MTLIAIILGIVAGTTLLELIEYNVRNNPAKRRIVVNYIVAAITFVVAAYLFWPSDPLDEKIENFVGKKFREHLPGLIFLFTFSAMLLRRRIGEAIRSTNSFLRELQTQDADSSDGNRHPTNNASPQEPLTVLDFFKGPTYQILIVLLVLSIIIIPMFPGLERAISKFSIAGASIEFSNPASTTASATITHLAESNKSPSRDGIIAWSKINDQRWKTEQYISKLLYQRLYDKKTSYQKTNFIIKTQTFFKSYINPLLKCSDQVNKLYGIRMKDDLRSISDKLLNLLYFHNKKSSQYIEDLHRIRIKLNNGIDPIHLTKAMEIQQDLTYDEALTEDAYIVLDEIKSNISKNHKLVHLIDKTSCITGKTVKEKKLKVIENKLHLNLPFEELEPNILIASFAFSHAPSFILQLSWFMHGPEISANAFEELKFLEKLLQHELPYLNEKTRHYFNARYPLEMIIKAHETFAKAADIEELSVEGRDPDLDKEDEKRIISNYEERQITRLIRHRNNLVYSVVSSWIDGIRPTTKQIRIAKRAYDRLEQTLYKDQFTKLTKEGQEFADDNTANFWGTVDTMEMFKVFYYLHKDELTSEMIRTAIERLEEGKQFFETNSLKYRTSIRFANLHLTQLNNIKRQNRL